MVILLIKDIMCVLPKNDDIWYTCNDDRIDFGVKLRCNPAIKDDLLIPYLLIYEKVLDSEVPRQGEISMAMHSKENVAISSQDKDASVELENELDNINTNKKGKRLDNQVNSNKLHDHEKDAKNISELMKRNLLKELEAQKKRISDIECKRKHKDELMIEIDTKKRKLLKLKKQKRA